MARSVAPKKKPSATKSPKSLDRQEWAKRIGAAWQKSLDGIFEAGRLLIDAKADLTHGGFTPMIESDLPFGERTAQMLMKIASDPRIADPKHASLLPPHWATLHALTLLPDAEFKRAIEQKIINPEMARKDLDLLKPKKIPVTEKSYGALPKPANPSPTKGYVANDDDPVPLGRAPTLQLVRATTDSDDISAAEIDVIRHEPPWRARQDAIDRQQEELDRDLRAEAQRWR
jgi:hypothetical protein